jgi:hypothetical protein
MTACACPEPRKEIRSSCAKFASYVNEAMFWFACGRHREQTAALLSVAFNWCGWKREGADMWLENLQANNITHQAPPANRKAAEVPCKHVRVPQHQKLLVLALREADRNTCYLLLKFVSPFDSCIFLYMLFAFPYYDFHELHLSCPILRPR